MSEISRRNFIKTAAIAAGVALAPKSLFSQLPADKKTKIVVVEGSDTKAMLSKGIDALGGWRAFVKPGRIAVVKPNAAFASKPEQGANTSPLVVGEIVAACKAAKASRVVLPEFTLANPDQAFGLSGIKAAADKAGGELYALTKQEQFREIEIPAGKRLKKAEIAVDVIDAPCLINVPTAKQHGGAMFSLSMKNWMGSIRDRGYWHRNDLHQCIADFSTLVKPSLVIIDATRLLLTNGPGGPGEMAYPRQLIFGTDPVAVDAYAVTLFNKKPLDVPYIKLAQEAGVGTGDLSQVDVIKLRV